MQPVIERKKHLLYGLRSTSCPSTIAQLKADLKEATKVVKDRTEIAKNKWASFLGNKVNDLNITPKQAWAAAYEIKDGVRGHHKKKVPTVFKDENGKLASTPTENITI
jgi:hypothetical protein